MYLIKNVFNNKDDISILRNQDELQNLINIKNFTKIK